MKKILNAFLVIGLLAFLPAILSAQNYYKGETYLHIGAALPYNMYEEGDRIQIPPVLLTYEKTIIDKLTLGGSLGYSASRGSIYRFIGDQYFHRHQYALVMLRSTYHFEFFDPDRFDFYGGMGLGAKIGWASFVGEGDLARAGFSAAGAASGTVYSIFAGMHYYFPSGLNLFGEFGFGSMPVQLGIQFQL